MNDILGFIGKAAPVLGTILGGPVGGLLTNTAVKALSGALGVGEDEESIKNALKTDPDALAKVMIAEKQVELHLATTKVDMVRIERESQTERERIAADDRNSARRMQRETESLIPAILAASIFGMFGYCLFVAINYGFPANSSGIAQVLVGQLSGGVGIILTFYFGSSVGSKLKTSMMAGVSKAKGVFK